MTFQEQMWRLHSAVRALRTALALTVAPWLRLVTRPGERVETRSTNDIAYDIVQLCPAAEPFVEEWFAITTSSLNELYGLRVGVPALQDDKARAVHTLTAIAAGSQHAQVLAQQALDDLEVERP